MRTDPIIGRYVYLNILDTEYRVYVEEAGEGVPVLLQHTAGSDGRQWRHLLADPELTREFRFIAHDLPFHGKSLPPVGPAWWSERYSLTQEFLLEFTTAMVDAFAIHDGIFMGCSMGGHLAPVIALHRPGLFQAVVAVQGGLVTQGVAPFNDYLSHPRASNALKAALMLGQTSPTSPEHFRRETGWGYAQGGPQIFQGDLDYYWGEHNLSETAKDIDTSRTSVHVMAGEYDWSATPDKARALADAIPGATFTRLEGVGHFPMSENPVEFKAKAAPLLRDIARRIAQGSQVDDDTAVSGRKELT